MSGTLSLSSTEASFRATENLLYHGDNLDVLRQRVGDASVDLIYLDPPFKSGAIYTVRDGKGGGEKRGETAFADRWEWSGDAAATLTQLANGNGHLAGVTRALEALLGPGDLLGYLVMMAPRLAELRRILKPAGSIYLHCDPESSHYLKLLMDAVFGRENFRNELVWYYGGRGAKAVSHQFPRNHDVILLYSREPGSSVVRRQYRRRHFTAAEARRHGFRLDESGRWFKTAPRGDYSDESIRRLETEGRIHRTRSGSVRVKYFLETEDGVIGEFCLIGDTWLDVPDAMHLGNERVGYPTQKPLALLERIIASGSDEGDLVLDPFCGSGTALVAAHKLGRRWIGIDSSALAIDCTRRRLVTSCAVSRKSSPLSP